MNYFHRVSLAAFWKSRSLWLVWADSKDYVIYLFIYAHWCKVLVILHNIITVHFLQEEGLWNGVELLLGHARQIQTFTLEEVRLKLSVELFIRLEMLTLKLEFSNLKLKTFRICLIKLVTSHSKCFASLRCFPTKWHLNPFQVPDEAVLQFPSLQSPFSV